MTALDIRVERKYRMEERLGMLLEGRVREPSEREMEIASREAGEWEEAMRNGRDGRQGEMFGMGEKVDDDSELGP